MNILSFIEKPEYDGDKKLIFESVYNNLGRYRSIKNINDMQCFLEEIEWVYGKNGIWELMLMDIREKLGFYIDVMSYEDSMKDCGLYTKMTKMRHKLQEFEDPVIKEILRNIVDINVNVEKNAELVEKVKQLYFCKYNNENGLFESNEEYYDTLRNLYGDKNVPLIN